eukprot:5866109-Pyramimonas_sp.AAC.1
MITTEKNTTNTSRAELPAARAKTRMPPHAPLSTAKAATPMPRAATRAVATMRTVIRAWAYAVSPASLDKFSLARPLLVSEPAAML